MNFNALGLKKLIVTCYATSPVSHTQLSLFDNNNLTYNLPKKKPYKVEITEVTDLNKDGRVDLLDVEYLLKNVKNVCTFLNGDGDFRSDECRELLKEADVVITNPPFSLFREYIALLEEYRKYYIIIGNMNAVTYKEIFPMIAENKLWLGYSCGHFWFKVPNSYEVKKTDFKIDENGQKWRRMGNICWFTNVDIEKRHENMVLFKKYNPIDYPKYDNYDAINVNKTIDIPCDYDGVMGVPITFLDKYNPDQFEIVAFRKGNDGKDLVYTFTQDIHTESNKREREREREREQKLCNLISEYSSREPDNLRRCNQTDIKRSEIIPSSHNPFTTSIPGLIKNSEGIINGKITYARITIRKRRGGHEN